MLDPVPAVVQAVSRQLQALDRCLGLKSQADANSGRPVVAVTVLAVKVAQNAAASELDAVYAEAQAWLAGLLHPKTRGRKGSKSALRILEVEMVGQKRMNEQKKKKKKKQRRECKGCQPQNKKKKSNHLL